MLIALDSNILIAALSPNEEQSAAARQLIRTVAQGKHHAIASSIAYGEVLGISTAGAHDLDLESFFSSIGHFSTISAGDAICLKAGQLRLRYGSRLKLPDALHAATALAAGAAMFITNDKLLAKITREIVPTTALADWR